MPSKTEVSGRALRAAQDATYAVRHGRSLGNVAQAIDLHFAGYEEVLEALEAVARWCPDRKTLDRHSDWLISRPALEKVLDALRRAEPVEERK